MDDLPNSSDVQWRRRYSAAYTGVFTNTKFGFPPCTARAVMEILRYYNIELKGKKAAVIGRSLVIGRSVAMLLMHEGATVTVCHTGTLEVPSVRREAVIVIAASGMPSSVFLSLRWAMPQAV